MTIIFAGVNIDTKPPHPRDDVSSILPERVSKRTYRMYNDLIENRFDDFSLHVLIGDNLTTAIGSPKPQSLLSALDSVRDFFVANINRNDMVRQATENRYLLVDCPIIGGKSRVRLRFQDTTPYDDADVDPDRVAIYVVLNSLVESQRDLSTNLFYNTYTRIAELAREKRFWVQNELIRDAAPLPDNSNPSFGELVTIAPPTWTGGVADVAVWLKNGETIKPLQSGLAPLVFEIMPEDVVDGISAYSVKAGIRRTAGRAPDQWVTSNPAIIVPDGPTALVGYDHVFQPQTRVGTSQFRGYNDGRSTSGITPHGMISPKLADNAADSLTLLQINNGNGQVTLRGFNPKTGNVLFLDVAEYLGPDRPAMTWDDAMSFISNSELPPSDPDSFAAFINNNLNRFLNLTIGLTRPEPDLTTTSHDITVDQISAGIRGFNSGNGAILPIDVGGIDINRITSDINTGTISFRLTANDVSFIGLSIMIDQVMYVFTPQATEYTIVNATLAQQVYDYFDTIAGVPTGIRIQAN